MTAEEAMREYPNWVKRKTILEIQIKNMRSMLETDMIDTMTFSHPQGEKVQSSNISDKTAATALMYKSLAEKEYKETFINLDWEYKKVCYETGFFECCVSTLKNYLPDLILDLASKKFKWSEIAAKYHISQSMVGKCRKKALKELEVFYSERDDMYIKSRVNLH
ncbi:MAG: hypothetical protein IJ736_08880 [Firmicutes bacterium]|nr:hypothetical protein [Bacillota bacterium]